MTTIAHVPKEILISSDLSELRVAVLEEGRASEAYVERRGEGSIAGNIYLSDSKLINSVALYVLFKTDCCYPACKRALKLFADSRLNCQNLGEIGRFLPLRDLRRDTDRFFYFRQWKIT